MTAITLTVEQARKLREAAQMILDWVPDPGAPVHAKDPGRPIGLCGRGTARSRYTTDVGQVTCGGCKATAKWEIWAWRARGEY